MPLSKFDHVNVLTANVEVMAEWYEKVLGLSRGWRPNFSMHGAWMYLDGHPFVHLVEVDETPGEAGRVEHFAFSAEDLEGFRATLKDHGIDGSEIRVPGTDILQVNVFDPDGNHLHIDFNVPE